jgi:hypothetical protein
MRLNSPYIVDVAFAQMVYYATLYNLNAKLVKQMHRPPKNLIDAYDEAIKASTN